MAEWQRLADYLQRTSGTIHLTWSELSELVGGLPPSATDHRPWWSGDRPHVRAWKNAGYELTAIRLGAEVTFGPKVGTSVATPPAAGSSGVQRSAETPMLEALGAKLGAALTPRRLTSPSGSFIDVDGVSSDGALLVECWAHQGPSKVAQKYKLVNDATKLHWAASWLVPRPSRLVLCVTDEAAVKHLRGTSWQGQAIAALGVEVMVVELSSDVIDGILEAQRQQFR